MSSSMFIESSSLLSDASEYVSNSDSNLVVVYGKNGISFDDKGLENLIEEKKIASISVIRLTSPTPSMKDEEEADAKLEEMLRRQELDSSECSDGNDENGSVYNNKRASEDIGNNESSVDEDEEGECRSSNESVDDAVEENKAKVKKASRRRGRHSIALKHKFSSRKRSERPEIVGLRLEEFYPPEDANEIVKEALKMAGLGPDRKSKEDYEFQLFVIRNDHCYTPFTSPTQMKAKLAADKLEMDKKTNSRKVLGTFQGASVAGKQLFVRKKPNQKQESLNIKTTSTPSLHKDKICSVTTNKVKKDCKDIKFLSEEDCADDSNVQLSNDECDDSKVDEEDEESEGAPTEEESDDTDNDRDSDLDFDVNNPKGRRRKIKILKSAKRGSAGSSKLLKYRRFHSQEDPAEQLKKPTLLATTVNRPKSLLKNPNDVGRITVRSTPTKIVHAGGGAVGVTGSTGPIKVPSTGVGSVTHVPKRSLEVKSNIAAPSLPTTSTSSNVAQKSFLVKGCSPVHTLSPQHHKEIIINKQIMSSPKTKGFTDLNTLIEQTEKAAYNVVPSISKFIPKQRTVFTAAPSAAVGAQNITTPIKGFMPIGLDTAAKNQLPAQISIHTHQSSSELEAEHDKQLDLINSIVQDELKKPNSIVSPATNINKNIPELVKMLESTEKVLECTSSSNKEDCNLNIIKNIPVCNNPVTISAVDINNANLLATPGDDDVLPDDILQLVDMIQDEKTLQEAVKVFTTGDCNESISHTSNSMANQNPPPLSLITCQQQISKVNILEDIPHSSKSIIQMSISNLPSTLSTPKSPIAPSRVTPILSLKSPLIRKEPIQIIRGNGRVITLPPIEAPTTRAKRRAQAQPTVTGQIAANYPSPSSVAPVIVNESSLDYSVHSNSSASSIGGITQEKKSQDNTNRRRGSKESVTMCGTGGKEKSRGKSSASKKAARRNHTEADASDSGNEDDDDPNKLWCICRQPHNNRFMICCDACEDWFHGTCVNITKAMGLEMEQKGVDWTCPKCVKKQEEMKQPKITDLLIKKPAETVVRIQAGSNPTTTTSVMTAKTLVSNVVTSTNTAQTVIDTTKTKIQPGQFINLKDLSSSGKKVIIQATAGGISGQKKLFVTTQPLRTTSTTQINPIRTITVVKHISNPTTQTLQHQSIKVIKTISPAQSTTQNVTTTVTATTPNLINTNEPFTLCIVCQKTARSNSIYCSDDCIRKHAQNALNTFMTKSQSETTAPGSPLIKIGSDEKTKKKAKGLFEDLLSMADRKPKVERVSVYERKSGRILTGNSAPTISNLKKWLQENPTFEVVQPGSAQALDIEKRQKLRTQHSSSPTLPTKSATSPPPLKLLPLSSPVQQKSDVSRSNSPQTYASPNIKQTPAPQSKSNKSVYDIAKSSSPSTVSRPNTPKQLQKYPQHGVKIDKSPKPSDDTKYAKEKVSTTKRQVSSESINTKPPNQEGEPIRLLVRRTLKEQLFLRMQDTDGSALTPSIGEDVISKTVDIPKLTSEEIEEFAKATELEMYNYFNRDAGMKYKAKYRSLIFNIKDRKNHTLFAKICGKKIEPKQLVRMTPDEMASQELAQWREQENKHQLEMIKKSELDMLACAKNYVLKTHKGEEVIESKSSEYENVDISIPVKDVVAALNNTNFIEETPSMNRSQNHWSDMESTFMAQSNVSESHLHSFEGEKLKTSKEKEKEREKDKDRHRDRERNRDGRERRHKSKDRYRDKSRSRKRSRSHSRSRSCERSEKRHKTTHKDERREREKDKVKDRLEREQHTTDVVVDKKTTTIEKKIGNVSKSRDVSLSKKSQHQDQHSLESYNLVDQILESTKTVEEAANLFPDRDKELENIKKALGTPLPTQPISSTTNTGSIDSGCVIDIPAPSSYSESDQEPTSTVSIPTPPHDPYVRFMFADSPSFADNDNSCCNTTTLWTGDINMVDVASFHLCIQPVLGNCNGLAKLLSKELDVVGRIGPETVWDYISKIKKSPNKEIVIIRLIPASESETSAYKILYEYLDNRNRLGVVKSISPYIKDFYIYPLGAGKLMPIVLRHSEPVEFYDDPYRPDMLVGILIKVVGKRHNPIGQTSSIGIASSSNTDGSKLTSRSNEGDSIQTPPGSPKLKKRRQSIVPKDIDIDAIIKAPIVSKSQKGIPTTTTSLIALSDADEPYSPGGSSDDDLPLLPVKLPVNPTQMQTAEDELKRKMEEINRQIAAQEMEIAGLLTGESTKLGTTSAKTTKVLANIAIPSNLSQILASIKPAASAQESQLAVPPPPPLIGSLIKNVSTSVAGDGYNQADRIGSAYDVKCSTSSSSRLANLSEAELLSMVPDDISIAPKPQVIRYEEPPPPGV